MNRFLVLTTVTAILAVTHGHVGYSKTTNQLHPVHGLYVKPSIDGTTGDLYVAATEESGAKTQWLTDQPIHFLSMQPQPAIPTNFNTEELNTHKRAVVNPPMQYAYALPAPASPEASAVPVSYPYALPTPTSSPAPVESKTEVPATAAVPQYNPYQFFYPQMMSAYANMMSILKDVGFNEETANAVVTPATPMWPHSYAYPYQYVMVDPNAWAQAQVQPTAAPVAPTTTATPIVKENE